MHTIVRWYIRTSFGFLITGVLLGLWMLVRKDLLGTYPHPQLITAHTHLILVGFVMGMILGVAQWMFPRPPREGTHYSPDLALAVYYLFAFSTVMRTVGEISQVASTGSFFRWLSVLGSAGQVLAFALFFYNMWPRIRPIGSQLREQKGEKF